MKELRPIKESGSAEDFEKEALIQRFRGCSSSAEEIISRFTFYTQLLNNGNFVDAASGYRPGGESHKPARKAIDEGPWQKIIAYEQRKACSYRDMGRWEDL
ncbi:hypothetical protein Bca4012_077065 [Brassica carinata]